MCVSTLGAMEQTDAVSEELCRNRHFLSAFWKASLLFWLTGKEICNYTYKIWGSKVSSLESNKRLWKQQFNAKTLKSQHEVRSQEGRKNEMEDIPM